MHIYLFYFWITLVFTKNIACQYCWLSIENGVLDFVLNMRGDGLPEEYCMSILLIEDLKWCIVFRTFLFNINQNLIK